MKIKLDFPNHFPKPVFSSRYIYIYMYVYKTLSFSLGLQEWIVNNETILLITYFILQYYLIRANI